MLSLITPFDVQSELRDFIKQARKQRKLSVSALSIESGVPNSTIRKFENTGHISLRQFLMLYGAVAKLQDIRQLTQPKIQYQNIDEVLRDA